MRAVALGILAVVLVTARTAAAEEPVPITDRDWALDLYRGAALGSARIVGMGGVQVALAEGSAGTLGNPAAPAVRKATSTGWWDWDWHVDAMEAVYASDFDNNGIVDDGRTSTTGSAGIAGMYYGWGAALVVSTQRERLTDTGGGELSAVATVAKLAVADTWGDETWAAGAAIRAGTLDVAGARSLFTITGASLEGGVLYRPYGEDLRVGATLGLPVTGRNVNVAACDPVDCEGYILPERVAVPWEVAAGVAWRLGPTRWNQFVGGKFRDERAVIVAADLRLVGDGMGLEAFSRNTWQRSGRHVSFGANLGAEWEALPGRLRLRGGTYWEPGRFADVRGRPHLTAGVEVGFFTFRFWWNKKYRLRLGLTGDFAPRFGNAGLSFGFWN
ncbi:MAG: hypothetical protein K8M05_15805 [Deltaproteobacteria bacterium]|nr:hypothetical protein [Kofleriaceae bacterium]